MTDYPQQIEDRIPEYWGKGLDIPESWYPLVTELDAALSELSPTYVIHQVKEKFGGLRYYIDESSFSEDMCAKASALISEAENASYDLTGWSKV